eukprot:CAMPEP_0170145910 /NCGR_PEP_ID=MMETSP0033_2-20121228/26871_1 /TAXON_ID=195969 /ORGANISM="Dolichomastix tenuilepis, Strain CCMP3274" /LENGTH=72 /DNA_ID=CAMNT_0010382563 /DNA_START=186 /DNA_END=401 /DNA_ORIENTATION=+
MNFHKYDATQRNAFLERGRAALLCGVDSPEYLEWWSDIYALGWQESFLRPKGTVCAGFARPRATAMCVEEPI